MAELRFFPLKPSDLFAIEPQASQRMSIGIRAGMDAELAAMLCNARCAWAARLGRRRLACFGIVEQFAGTQGLGWAILADGLGKHLLPITRFAAYEIAHCGLARLELIALCADIEPAIAWGGSRDGRPLDTGQIVALACRMPTRQMRWAAMLGMSPAHVLRCYGAAAESHMLFERIAPPAAVEIERAA